MEPMVHYIPLKKDFTNFDEVIRRFRDERAPARNHRERLPRPDGVGPIQLSTFHREL